MSGKIYVEAGGTLELPIGKYTCVLCDCSAGCAGCAMEDMGDMCFDVACNAYERQDGKYVIFKKLEQ